MLHRHDCTSCNARKLQDLFQNLKGFKELIDLYPDAVASVDLLIEDYIKGKKRLKRSNWVYS